MTKNTPDNNKSLLPPIASVLSNGISIVITLLGIMSIAQSRIEWKSFLSDLVIFYQKHVTQPIMDAIAPLLKSLEEAWGEKYYWLIELIPDYIPIASAFFFGLVISISHAEEKPAYKLIWNGLRDIFRAFIPNSNVKILEVTIGIGMIFVAYVLSPVILILIPLYFVVAGFAVLSMFAEFIWIALPYVFGGVAVMSAIWIFVDKDGFLTKLGWLLTELRKEISITSLSFQSFFLRIRKYGWKSVIYSNSSFRQEASEYLKILFVQYYIACIIITLFLIAYALNKAL